MTKTYLTLILFSFFSCNINYCQEKGIFYGTSIKNLFNFKKISSFSLKESSFFYAAKRGYDFFKRASFNQKKLGLLTSGLLWCGYKITKPYLKFYGRYFLIPLVYGCNDTLAKKYFNSLYTIDGKPSFLNIANICLQTKYNPPELDNQNLFNIESIIDWYHDSKKNTYEKNLKILQSALFLKNKYINKLSDKEKKEFDLAYCNTHDFFEKNEELKKRYEAICENNQEDMYEVYKKNIENEYNEISKNIEYKKKDLTFHFQEISKIINRIKQNHCDFK